MNQRIAALTVAGLVLLPAGSARAGMYSEKVLADNPIGYWRLNEPAGTTGAGAIATLGSNSALTGTLGGNSNIGNVGARPPEFPGMESDNTALNGRHVTIGASPGALATWTLEAVAFPTATGRRVLFGNDATGSNNDWVMGVGAGNFAPTKWTVEVQSAAGESHLSSTENAVLNEWAHVMATYDGDFMRIYVNGAEAGNPVEMTGQFLGTRAAKIGDAYKNHPFLGLIDEVAVYDRALSGDDVAAHYDAFMGIPEPGTMTLLAIGGLAVLLKRRRK